MRYKLLLLFINKFYLTCSMLLAVYQLDLVIPGISPLSANSLKQIRHKSKSLK